MNNGLPKIGELFVSMAGGDEFTKIDLRHIYLQRILRGFGKSQANRHSMQQKRNGI